MNPEEMSAKDECAYGETQCFADARGELMRMTKGAYGVCVR
jgi:hypothetical protein